MAARLPGSCTDISLWSVRSRYHPYHAETVLPALAPVLDSPRYTPAIDPPNLTISDQLWGLLLETLSSTCSLMLSCLPTDMLMVPPMISTVELSGSDWSLQQQLWDSTSSRS